ncbi:MAG: hypothetical protein E6G08_12940 [Actinobacteria bacterium]|nr:MAG: hypothetical protein E6G08_12940 [Actinomycetota bacterium]
MEYVAPSFEPPHRVLLLVGAGPGWYQAEDAAARKRVIARLQSFFDGWRDGGARLVGSFDDDYFVVGQPSSLGWSIFVLYEVPSLDLVVERVNSTREEVDGERLDRAFRMEVRVGRSLFLLPD